MLISSQRYINEDIVDQKLKNEDFSVLISPSFEVDGQEYQVVLDGHHSLSAAKIAGVIPNFTVATAVNHDAVSLIISSTPDDFMMAVHMGDDYYDVDTGICVW